MFLRGKLCQKKILFICSFLVFCLSCLFAVAFSSDSYAANLPIATYGLEYELSYGGEYFWSNNLAVNNYFNGSSYWYRLRRYQFNSGTVIFDGQYATIHFETNIVAAQPASVPYWGDYVNRDKIKVNGCFYDNSGSNWLAVNSQYITTYVTDWTGPAPSINYKNKTLTVIGDVILTTPISGSHTIHCVVGNTDYNFWLTTNSSSSPLFYVEQQPTTIEWSGTLPDPVSREQVQAIQSIEEGEQRRWESDKQELSDKEDELSDQADDLSLSATVPANPVFRFFKNPFGDTNQRCYTTISVHNLFNSSAWNVCSPFPSQARQFISAATNFFLLALLLRLYFKKMKGGVDG